MKEKTATRFVFFIYFLVLVWIVMFKMQFSIADIPHYRALNLDPFHDALKHPIRTREIIDNIVIFIPYGILMAMLKEKRSFFAKIFPIFFTSLTFEALQYFFAIGSTDVNDIITNTLGGVLGVFIFWIFKKVFRRNAQKVVITLALIMISLLLFFIIAYYLLTGTFV
ncbi:MAG: VanZ family protein [Bacillota bacterium]|nr:VanZ family protein [Bacillota bacterium]